MVKYWIEILNTLVCTCCTMGPLLCKNNPGTVVVLLLQPPYGIPGAADMSVVFYVRTVLVSCSCYLVRNIYY